MATLFDRSRADIREIMKLRQAGVPDYVIYAKYPRFKPDGWEGLNITAQQAQAQIQITAIEQYQAGKISEDEANRKIEESLMIKTDYGTKSFGEGLASIGRIAAAEIGGFITGGPWGAAAAATTTALEEKQKSQAARIEKAVTNFTENNMSVLSALGQFASSDLGKQVIGGGLDILKGALGAGGNTGILPKQIVPGDTPPPGGGGGGADTNKVLMWVGIVVGGVIVLYVLVKSVFKK